MDHPDIFGFSEYKAYLAAALTKRREVERGAQARMAEALRCQSAYLSMVLKGSADLSVEQADAVNAHLAHTSAESHYFILLVQRARSGTKRLRQYFDRQIEAVIAERSDLSRRLDYQGVLTSEQRAVFYSAWYYMAIHMMLTIKDRARPDRIAKYLDLPIETVHQVIEFLLETGLAVEERGADGTRLTVGARRLHLPNTSPYVAQSHGHWRLRCLQALQHPSHDGFHYSSVVSMSREDIPRLKEMMIRCIEEIRGVTRVSAEEDLVCYTMDLFDLGAPRS